MLTNRLSFVLWDRFILRLGNKANNEEMFDVIEAHTCTHIDKSAKQERGHKEKVNWSNW